MGSPEGKRGTEGLKAEMWRFVEFFQDKIEAEGVLGEDIIKKREGVTSKEVLGWNLYTKAKAKSINVY